jgi:hypothetical protein
MVNMMPIDKLRAMVAMLERAGYIVLMVPPGCTRMNLIRKLREELPCCISEGAGNRLSTAERRKLSGLQPYTPQRYGLSAATMLARHFRVQRARRLRHRRPMTRQ